MVVGNEAFTLSPNKIVFYTRFDKVSKSLDLPPYSIEGTRENQTANLAGSTVNKLVRSFHNFEISANAKRNLQQKVQWLFHLAKKKDIKTYSGKRIHSFRCAFLTFTLPSKQFHPTVEITKDLFNHCLTVFRQRYKMENYVWRLEFQKNGNVHYHLVTDTYIDYFAALAIWNKVLETKGYVSKYKEKHQSMSLQDYLKAYPPNAYSDFSVQAKRYAKGKSLNWETPNTVDVKSVVSKAKITYYISKYFNKTASHGVACNGLDNEDNSKTIRLWFCSRSLSKLKSISAYIFETDYDIKYLAKALKNAVKVRFKYAFVYFFDLQETTGFVRSFLSKLLRDYSQKNGYIPWVNTI